MQLSDLRMLALPIGPTTDDSPAKRPERAPIRGRLVDLVPINPLSHAKSLFELTCGPENEYLWTYLLKGPFHDRKAFDEYLRQLATSEDPLAYTIVNKRSKKAVGWATYMRIEPAHRVIEVGHIMFSRELQHTAGGTEAIYLLARRGRSRSWLPEVRVEVQRAERAVKEGGPEIRIQLRRDLPSAHDRQGEEQRHRLVLDAGHRMAEAQEGLRDWLQPSNFNPEGRQKTSLSALNSVA